MLWQDILEPELQSLFTRLLALSILLTNNKVLMTMPVAMLAQWLTLPVLFPILSYATLALVVIILLTQQQLWRRALEH